MNSFLAGGASETTKSRTIKGQKMTVQEKRPLRILMIAPTSFFSDYGGHIRILEETKALQELGHKVAIVTYYKGSDLPGIDIRRTAPLPWHTDYEVGSSRHKIAFDVYLAVKAWQEFRRFRPHIIHGHMHEGALIGGVLARMYGVPLVFDFQGSLTGEMVDHNFLDPNGRIYPWVYRLEKYIDHLPNAILTSSHQSMNLLKDKFDVPGHILHPLPDCADPTRFDPHRFTEADKQARRQELNIPPDRPIVAYLGLLTEYQGVPHLLDAAAQLIQQGENVHFLVMGYPNVPYYQALAAEKGLSGYITFTGKVEYRFAPDYLALGDIAVAPKMSSTEGSGKLLNYMALGQPVVAYDSPVHREYLAEFGVYAPLGDSSALAEGIKTLLYDEEKRICLGKQLRERALTVYSWQAAMKQVANLYYHLTAVS